MRARGKGAGAQCSDFVLLWSAERSLHLFPACEFVHGGSLAGGRSIAGKHGQARRGRSAGEAGPQGLFCAGVIVACPNSARARGGRGCAVQWRFAVVVGAKGASESRGRLRSGTIARRSAMHCWVPRASTEKPTGRRRRRPAAARFSPGRSWQILTRPSLQTYSIVADLQIALNEPLDVYHLTRSLQIAPTEPQDFQHRSRSLLETLQTSSIARDRPGR